MKLIHEYDYIIITGATGSGKTSLADKLVEIMDWTYHFKNYTTRPIRQCEMGGNSNEYIFVTPDEMAELRKNGSLSLHVQYNTAYGTPEYGFPLYVEHQHGQRTAVQLLGLNDVDNFFKCRGMGWFPRNSLMIILFTDYQTLLKNLSPRNDPSESERRALQDIRMIGGDPEDGRDLYITLEKMAKLNHSSLVNIVNHKNRMTLTDIVNSIVHHQSSFYSNVVTIYPDISLSSQINNTIH